MKLLTTLPTLPQEDLIPQARRMKCGITPLHRCIHCTLDIYRSQCKCRDLQQQATKFPSSKPSITPKNQQAVRRCGGEPHVFAVLAEACAPGAVISEVARRHGLLPSQVFKRRRLAALGVIGTSELPSFIAVEVAAELPATASEPVGEGSAQRADAGEDVVC